MDLVDVLGVLPFLIASLALATCVIEMDGVYYAAPGTDESETNRLHVQVEAEDVEITEQRVALEEVEGRRPGSTTPWHRDVADDISKCHPLGIPTVSSKAFIIVFTPGPDAITAGESKVLVDSCNAPPSSMLEFIERLAGIAA